MSPHPKNEPPDYCWSSSFENGLFYIENWQTGHKFRAVIGLTDMTVQLLNARSISTQTPTVRRINGILHFLTDLKLNFYFPAAQQAIAFGSISTMDSVSSCGGGGSLSPRSQPSAQVTTVAEAFRNLVPTSGYPAQPFLGPTRNPVHAFSQRSESHNVSVSSPLVLGGTAIVESCGPVNFQSHVNKGMPLADPHPLVGNLKPNRTPVSERMCQMCRRVFSNRSMLRRHMVVHSSVPKFTCELCGKGFKYRWNYTAHVREKCPKLNESNGNFAVRNPTENEQCGEERNNSSDGSVALVSEITGIDTDMKKEFIE